MDRLNNIVIGVDFSKHSTIALDQAKRIARWNQTDLHFVHVVDKMVLDDLHKALARPSEEVTHDVEEITQSRIDDLFECDPLERRHDPPAACCAVADERRTCDETRIALKNCVVIGDPYSEIINRVRQVEADMLVLGSNGTSNPARGLGKVATKCIRQAPCRVMIVREEHALPYRSVVACISFASDCAPNVVKQAIAVAKRDQADLHIIHVFWPPWNILHYKSPTAASSPDYQIQYMENMQAELEQMLKDHQDDLDGIDVHCELIESPRPAEGIIDYVEQTHGDLVVVGTRGRSGMKEMVLGTQAEYVAHHAPVSVLVLRPNMH